MIIFACAIAVAIAAIRWLTLPPRTFAPGLPVIPIWVAFLPLIRSWLGLPLLGQDETYARYIAPAMSKHGAVVIFFGSQWNVLVGCPQGMIQLFGRERSVFHKSGNHRKLPRAVISALTGGNIISETGEKWRTFAHVIRPALKDRINTGGLDVACARLVQRLRRDGEVVAVTSIVQQYAMEAVTLCVFGKDLNFLVQPPRIHAVHTLVKRHIFHPLFLSVPALDNYPRLFPGRVVARKLIAQLEQELLATLPSAEAKAALSCKVIDVASSPSSSNVLFDLDQALLHGTFTSREYIDNLKILFIAGHENVQQALCSVLMVLARDPMLQDDIRQDALLHRGKDTSPFLHAIVHETLRLYPPIPQLINRRVADPCVLSLPSQGGAPLHVPLQPGTYVGWTAFGVHRGPWNSTWQPDPDVFRPSRWGTTVDNIDALARETRSRGEFTSFHGGLRACPGQAFALRSLHLSVTAILADFQLSLASDDGTKLTPGGLLAPRNLHLRLVPVGK
ncbi:Cytochrome P450-DIT2 [Vanrija pseudolonga]|uniref:Cytochrome P450-DIT2 n=1 Tax=Vanrija pseudolonga TaxID=143232 RepID=A0AAF1BEU1_9TREE|nr:Cytochrome P450-DIT2 [Vanrija pseudolonga]